MTQNGLRKLFELDGLPCAEAAVWASKQDDKTAEGLLAACGRQHWRRFVARNTRSVAILELLSRDESGEVRFGVAHNPHTPATLLERLSRDGDRGVRGRVARNPKTPAVVLEQLADEDEWMRADVACNPSAPRA